MSQFWGTVNGLEPVNACLPVSRETGKLAGPAKFLRNQAIMLRTRRFCSGLGSGYRLVTVLEDRHPLLGAVPHVNANGCGAAR